MDNEKIEVKPIVTIKRGRKGVPKRTKEDIKKEQREQKIDFILNVAKRHILSVGYKSVTVDDICSDCGISKKTFYVFFETKEDLYFSLISREFDQDLAYLEKQLLNKKSNPIEWVKAFVELAVDFLSKDVFNINLIMEATDSSSNRIGERYKAVMDEKCMDVVRKALLDGQKKGYFLGVKDINITAYACTKLFTAFTYLRTISFDKTKEREGYYTEVLTHMIMQLISG